MKRFLIITVGCALAAVVLASDPVDPRLAEVQRAIAEQGLDWQAGPTGVSDIPWEEFRRTLRLRVPETVVQPEPDPEVETRSYPSRFDWRDVGGVTPARNQGQCGSCWAFTLVGAAEAMARIYSGVSLDLSEQQILDCNTQGYDCEGGWFDAWTPLRDHGAVEEECYPYEAHREACRQGNCGAVAWFSGSRSIPNNVNSIKNSVQNHGPVVTAYTVYSDFSWYQGGCYDHAGTEVVNHGLVIVGWDDEMCGGQGAWIVKNSWGGNWGEGGFGYVKYGACRIGYGARVLDFTGATTATPTPGVTGWDVDMSLNQELFRPGDWFYLTLDLDIPGSSAVMDLYVVLDAGGNYWSWPNWNPGISYWPAYWVAGGQNQIEILSFPWPSAAGSGSDLVFHGMALDTDSQELRGYSACTWGYGT